MKIQDYVRVLRRRGWIIALSIGVAAISALVFSRLQEPVYRASMEVSIELARPDFGLTQTAKLLLRSYAYSIHSEDNAQLVIDQLGLLQTPRELAGDVKVVADDSLLVIKIEADHPDGEMANRIAQAWAQLLVDWRNEQNARQNKEDRVYASIIDMPSYGQVRPKTAINVAAGGIFGLVAGGVIVFALEWMEAGVVREPKRMEEELGLAVLGVIPPVAPAQR